jgi:hypothetical protein
LLHRIMRDTATHDPNPAYHLARHKSRAKLNIHSFNYPFQQFGI